MSLWFQLDTGIHSSNPISESFAGLITPVTAQNTGRSLAGTAASPARGFGRKPGGGVNDPAATCLDATMVVFGNFRAIRLSQVAAAMVEAKAVIPIRRNPMFTLVLID